VLKARTDKDSGVGRMGMKRYSAKNYNYRNAIREYSQLKVNHIINSHYFEPSSSEKLLKLINFIQFSYLVRALPIITPFPQS
jgi:hypothetical protein